MTNKRNLIYCCGGSIGYAEPFLSFGEVHDDDELLEESRLMILTGGEDINPKIYGEKWYREDSQAMRNMTPDYWFNNRRDEHEIAMYEKATKLGIPVYGTCRGLQMMHALNGGKLIQHINNHHGSHSIITNKGDVFPTNSIHHQACIPIGDDSMVVLATCTDDHIVEAAYYPLTKSVGVQYHPEMMGIMSEGRKYATNLVAELLGETPFNLLQIAA